MKLLSLFSGIGAFEKALRNIGVNYELVNYCEIDKFASRAYSLIHKIPESMNLWDVTTVDTSSLPNDIDLITYGFPCQDISVAGKQKGFVDENGELTRSGLFFQVLRIIEGTKPKIAIAENVKALTNKKMKGNFEIVLNSLSAAGYTNYWKVLNAKDYGVPQNRERVFIISVRNDVDTGKFEFPESFPLELKLKDMLETDGDEKYFLSEKALDRIKAIVERSKEKSLGYKSGVIESDGVCTTIDANYHKGADGKCAIVQVGQLYPNSGNPQAGRIYGVNGISPAMDTCNGGNRMPKIMDHVTAAARKLTPKECFRLMGFYDCDVDTLIENGISNAQLYKMAGNSIVVDVLEYLFKQIFKCIKLEDEDVKKIEEKKTVKFQTEKMIDLAALFAKEPELFEELAADYPCEPATYVFEVTESA